MAWALLYFVVLGFDSHKDR